VVARVPAVLVAVAVTLAGVAAGLTPSAAVPAGSRQPEPDGMYRSGRRADPSVRTFVVGARRNGRPLVAVKATFECDELELDGVLLATVRPNGVFRADSRAFSLTGGGTDSVDADVEVEGRFRGGEVDGTIDAEAEAFDNAGTTGTCDDEIDWKATAGAADPSLERIEATVALAPGVAVVAAGPDAAYLATEPDAGDEAFLHRIDAATNEITWQIEAGTDVSALAATADAVWIVTGGAAGLLRLDPATGEQVAGVPLDVAAAGAYSPDIGLVATDTAVWVAAQKLYRVDPATNTVAATLDLGDDAEDAVVAVDANAVYAGVNRARADEDADGPPNRLLRVDPSTNQITADVEGVGQFTALAAGDEALWAAPSFEPLRLLDPTTLDETGTVDVAADALAAAPPGAWVLTERGITAYDATDPAGPAVRIPLLGGDFGAIAAAGESVWVWDPRLGTLSRIAAG
jgi:hypothetical protein